MKRKRALMNGIDVELTVSKEYSSQGQAGLIGMQG